MNYLKVKIRPTDPVSAGLMIALLADRNYYAFEEKDDRLLAYIQEDDFSESVLKELLPPGMSYQLEKIEEQNWNLEWERSFDPVVVGNFVGIRAGFHEPLSHVEHEIVITPKMSFGTGHHPTTSMMLELMSHIDFPGRSVIDFGTGTGVLAILALKLGAAKVVAIDNDAWSVENARENFKNNNADHIELMQGDALPPGKTDILLANINLQVLIASAASIHETMQPGGKVLLSGFFIGDIDNILGSYENRFRVIEEKSVNEWSALLLQKN